MLEKIIEQYPENIFIKADGFDQAIIGVEENEMRLIYSVRKCLNILKKEMTETEAFEYFTFNVSGSYFGHKTPVYCWDNLE